jgi:hypothetical protein
MLCCIIMHCTRVIVCNWLDQYVTRESICVHIYMLLLFAADDPACRHHLFRCGLSYPTQHHMAPSVLTGCECRGDVDMHELQRRRLACRLSGAVLRRRCLCFLILISFGHNCSSSTAAASEPAAKEFLRRRGWWKRSE